jgi:superfamily II DNA or RNA helicase
MAGGKDLRMGQPATDARSSSSVPEDAFTLLFSQTFGIEKTLLLSPEYPVADIYGGSRYIDYALRTIDEKVAFEIDGLVWHAPEALPVAKYEDDLLRQNSLVHQGWRVYRWTDRQITEEPELVKEQLALFLERIPGLLSFDDFLPKQRGEVLELRPHQEEALLSLAALRAEGKTIGLLTHAQGAGKTVTAITDAKRLGGRTLFLAHTRDLVNQAYEKFGELWPQASTGLFYGGVHAPEAQNVIGSIQSVAESLHEFKPDAFTYVVIDEAHHATAPTYKRVLSYFRPQFLLGLTATPDRADGLSVLELFRDCAHRLSLREAVELGELAPIRCVRVLTNVDLSKVRFNQVQYNRRDIEQSVIIPPRDRLIVKTYMDHVRDRKAVAFCVNVRHGEQLDEQFRNVGVPAQSVSGRMPGRQREQCLRQFHEGNLRVLCACDILNEGWDCPDVEVLLMARPTLSKVIYLQQIGRGTRKAPGKECLVVFDFVDNAHRYNQSLSLHRVLGQGRYRPGEFVLAPQDLHEADERALAGGQKPTATLEIGLWTRDYEEIDVFNWQEAVAGMIPIGDLEVELAASEGTVRRAVERGELLPDHTLTLGERAYHYFARDRIEAIRVSLGLPKVDEHTLPELFAQFVAQMDMAASYKPVMLLSLLDNVDVNGKARLSDLTRSFRRFYEQRKEAGLMVERPTARMAQVAEMADDDVQRVLLEMPFEKFERRKYLKYDRDLAFIRFEPALWRQLKEEDLDGLRRTCQESITAYYERLAGT